MIADEKRVTDNLFLILINDYIIHTEKLKNNFTLLKQIFFSEGESCSSTQCLLYNWASGQTRTQSPYLFIHSSFV